jgi:ADP-ribose pyrophosphatase YjhB (NUDIX family)
VSVAAAIRNDDGHFLAIRRADDGAWQPPGGILELDESIEAGLIREVEEETGLRVEPLALTGVYKNMRRGVIALVFRCRLLAGTPRANDEALEVAWLSPAQLAERLAEVFEIRLTDALDQAAPRVRAHDGVRLIGEPHAPL